MSWRTRSRDKLRAAAIAASVFPDSRSATIAASRPSADAARAAMQLPAARDASSASSRAFTHTVASEPFSLHRDSAVERGAIPDTMTDDLELTAFDQEEEAAREVALVARERDAVLVPEVTVARRVGVS